MKLALVTLLLGGMNAWGQANSIFEVQNAYIRSTPPGITMTAAYLTITNVSDKAFKITGVRSELTEAIELHEHVGKESGTASMKHIKSVPLPARGKAVFSPRGYHIMLLGLKKPLVIGQKVKLDLEVSGHDLANNQSIPVNAVVKK